MSGIEGLGEVVTGGMLARAVEPGAGEAGSEHAHGGKCLNCGEALIGDFCHHCGQTAHIHRTLHAFFHDLMHGVLHFEGKTWRTLPMLVLHPGDLTRRYIAGERARFVSPIAIFLFSVFLMFAVFHSVGGPFEMPANVDAKTETLRDLREEVAENQSDLKNAETELAQAKAAGESTKAEEKQVAKARAELEAKQRALRVASAVGTASGAKESETNVRFATMDDAIKDLNVDTGVGSLDEAFKKAKANPELLLYKLQTNAYKYSWALIPISVPFVWLLFFWKRRFWLYDHTVFVTYSIAFMSLGLVVLSLLRPLGLPSAAVDNAIVFLPPIHMYRQLRGAYEVSRFGAVWRTFFLIVFASIAATLFLVLLLWLGSAD